MELTNVEILEAARKRSGLTQSDVAKALEVSLPTYSRWIKGGNFDDVMLVHADILEELLKVKFSVIHAEKGRRVKITLI